MHNNMGRTKFSESHVYVCVRPHLARRREQQLAALHLEHNLWVTYMRVAQQARSFVFRLTLINEVPVGLIAAGTSTNKLFYMDDDISLFHTFL